MAFASVDQRERFGHQSTNAFKSVLSGEYSIEKVKINISSNMEDRR
jgi:hypothetical protein